MRTKDPNCLSSTPEGVLVELLKSYGEAVMEMLMGPLCFDHMCGVVYIVDEALL